MNKKTIAPAGKNEVHPCFYREAAGTYGRLHLPVAPRCNIKCRYCDRRIGCVNENRPGVTLRIFSPQAALAYARKILTRDKRIKVIGISGPGEPLANRETLETLRLVHREFPGHVKCLSTNGLELPEKIPELKAAGLNNVTVTVNTTAPATGAKIYAYVKRGGKIYRGEEAARLLWERQREGIVLAVAAGLRVKVNTIFIPGINEEELPSLAKTLARLGVHLMNLVPLIPLADFSRLRPPGAGELQKMRARLRVALPQMDWCRQCRADAAGLLIEEEEEAGQKCSL
ncbi:MAG: radical SAM protein [Armatimonadetes bacterium]|nr:radical SAM protein [Armatimonadota bacterium]